MQKIGHLSTSGVFSLDGQDFDVDNNVWIVGDRDECVVLDCANDHEAIIAAVGDRRLKAIVCTHAHNDHINAAAEVAEHFDAPIWLHPDDTMLWEAVYADRRVDAPLQHGQRFTVGGVDVSVIHTPGHSPGGCCLYLPSEGVLFSGDTLFNGGPGATGRSFSSYPTILESIESRLFTLPSETIVHTGHGDSTRIGVESASLTEWKSKLDDSSG